MVSFDLDGTLTIGTTCLQYYVKKLGAEAKAIDLENLYKNYKIDDDEIANRYAKILKGTSKKQLDEWTSEIPRMSNIKEAVGKLKQIGFAVGITSIGPIFASEYFQCRLGFDFISGSEHEFIDGIHTGKMLNILTGDDKVRIVQKLSKERNIKMSEIIAVGDSRSDIPIFEKVGYRIALNADENLKIFSDQVLNSSDLLQVLNKILD